MRVSVFTPSHDSRFLDSAYESLAKQSLSDWEWIVLLNKGAQWKPPREDSRVRVSRAASRVRGVGALKRAACELVSGDILVELDHDDLLARGCLAAVADAFKDPKIVCVYSDWAQINEAHRVLAHAGLMLTQTPSTDGRGAFQDPSAVAYYNENSFMYLTQAALHDAIPELKARLQVSHLRTFYPSPGHQERDIAYVQANLLAVKEGPRQGGPLLC